MKNARNIAILALIALVIVEIPAAGHAAAGLTAALSIAFAALIAYFVARLYRERRVDIYGLGDGNRALLYVALGVACVLFAGAQIFSTALGTLIAVAVLAICAGALLRVYRVWRCY